MPRTIGIVTHEDIPGLVMPCTPELGADGVTLHAGCTTLFFSWAEWDELTAAAGQFLKGPPAPVPSGPFYHGASWQEAA